MPKIGSIGIPELLIILVVVLLIFGPRRLPDMAKGLGQSVREFRRGLRDMRKEFDNDESNDADGKAPAAAAPGSATASAAAAHDGAAAQPTGAVAANTAGANTAGANAVEPNEAAPVDPERKA